MQTSWTLDTDLFYAVNIRGKCFSHDRIISAEVYSKIMFFTFIIYLKFILLPGKKQLLSILLAKSYWSNCAFVSVYPQSDVCLSSYISCQHWHFPFIVWRKGTFATLGISLFLCEIQNISGRSKSTRNWQSLITSVHEDNVTERHLNFSSY